MYVDAQDTAQRPARWEPSRILERSDGKVKIGWIYWDGPEYQQWVDQSSELLAPFLSHTKGASPLNSDRNVSQFTASSQAGDVVGCGFDAAQGAIFFTKNGVLAGAAFTDVPLEPLYPAVELRASSTRVSCNFGENSFKFCLNPFQGILTGACVCLSFHGFC